MAYIVLRISIIHVVAIRYGTGALTGRGGGHKRICNGRCQLLFVLLFFIGNTPFEIIIVLYFRVDSSELSKEAGAAWILKVGGLLLHVRLLVFAEVVGAGVVGA